MIPRISVPVLGIVSATFLATALAAPPQPTPPGQKPVMTGYDIAVDSISRSGTVPVFTFVNKGQRSINRTLRFQYTSNQQPVGAYSISLALAPGQKTSWTGGTLDGGFARDGTIVEVTIDSDNELKEDNESNNTLARAFPIRKPRR